MPYRLIQEQKSAYFSNVQKVLAKYKNDLNVLVQDSDRENLVDRLKDDTVHLPAVLPNLDYQYVIDDKHSTYCSIDSNGGEHTYEFDYACSMPITLELTLTLLASDISQMIEIETFILSKYSCTNSLTFNHPNIAAERILFDIKSTDVQIGRDQMVLGTRPIYQSIITLGCDFCPSFWQPYHPAEIAFSQLIQKSVMKRIVALDELNKLYYKKGSPLLMHGTPKKWERCGYVPTEAELALRAKERLLVKILDSAIDDLPFDEDVRHGAMSCDIIYKKMCDCGYDIPTAVKADKQEIEERIAQYERNKQQEAAEQAARARVSYEYSALQSERQPSSGGFLRRAINAALDPDRPKKPSPYKDFMGAVGCQYGKKGYCLGCRLYHQCSRGAGGMMR